MRNSAQPTTTASRTGNAPGIPVDGISLSLHRQEIQMLAQNEAQSTGPLTIEETRYGDDVVIVSLAGEFDLSGAAVAKEMMERALLDPCDLVVIDMTDLEFL